MSDKTQQPTKNDRENMQVVQQIFHNLLEIAELYPKFPIAQHLSAILRRKSTSGPEFFYWSNKELLKRVEQHKKELEGEELVNEQQD